jgi:hypothetical protein
MRKLLVVVAAALAFALPSAASAQAPYVGARVGYALPFGGVTTNYGVRDYISSEVPLQIDAGFRLGRPVDLGLYFSYAFAQLPTKASDGCAAVGESCSANVIRVGAQVNMHSEITRGRELWAGLLGGYERLGFGSGAAKASMSGFELGVQGGFDFAADSFGFGPFGSLTAGQFTSFSAGGHDMDMPEKKFHGTFQVGVRGHFKI